MWTDDIHRSVVITNHCYIMQYLGRFTFNSETKVLMIFFGSGFIWTSIDSATKPIRDGLVLSGLDYSLSANTADR